MPALRIVHCADVHLETVFPDLRGGAGRRKGLADAFERIVDQALAREADVLTIGGDLYESERAGPQTRRFLCEQFARFGRPIYIAPGNHDPHAPAALLAHADLPDNVRIFNEAAWRAYPLPGGVTLFGFGHTPAEPGRPFPGARFDRGGVQIALVHGSDEARCPPGKKTVAPFTTAEVVASGASLLLTGHYHGGYVTHARGRPVVAYPGSPEPIRFGEHDPHGLVVVTLEEGSLSVESVPLARTRLVEATCDLEGASSENAAFARLEAGLQPYGRDDYVRLKLTGSIVPGTRLDLTLMEERLGSGLGSLALLDATVAYDFASIAREPTVRGHVARDLLARGEEGERALRFALAAFAGTDIAP